MKQEANSINMIAILDQRSSTKTFIIVYKATFIE